MKSEIISIFKKDDDIKKITDRIKNYSFDDFLRHEHFEFSVMEKATDEKVLKEVFTKFNLIKTIELRENEKGEKYYGFNYELKDGTFVVISLSLEGKTPMIINGYYAKRNYKQFEKNLRKNYSNRFI
ncbi:TPA: hypothetical protein DIU22_02040 [Candidatus Woesebacteria bacterium]|nr:hypothetical protein [Candidatus Woesebacteria bacterium]